MQVNVYDNACNERIVSGTLVKVIMHDGPGNQILNIYLKNCGFAEAFQCCQEDCDLIFK